jgi:hypothetical protein
VAPSVTEEVTLKEAEVLDASDNLEPDALVTTLVVTPIPSALKAEARPARFWLPAVSELRLITVGVAEPTPIDIE